MNLAYLPSPSQGVWHLGPLPLRAYALCILAGIFTAVWLTGRRWAVRGGRREDIADIAIWAVPFGILGGRLYHVVTDPELYFAADRQPLHALYIWDGGLGIPGAVALGAVGAFLGCRRRGIRLSDFADAAAPGLVLAQAIGRWGNYFNQELFGRPTDKPWGLEIDLDKRPPGYEKFDTFHPTFLYESLWNLGSMGVVLYLDRKLRLGFGRAFAVYVMAYCLGRLWIEHLRIDTIELNDVLGLRWGEWMSIGLFVAALAYFVLAGRRHPAPDTREASVYVEGREPADDVEASDSSDVAAADTANGSPSS